MEPGGRDATLRPPEQETTFLLLTQLSVTGVQVRCAISYVEPIIRFPASQHKAAFSGFLIHLICVPLNLDERSISASALFTSGRRVISHVGWIHSNIQLGCRREAERRRGERSGEGASGDAKRGRREKSEASSLSPAHCSHPLNPLPNQPTNPATTVSTSADLTCVRHGKIPVCNVQCQGAFIRCPFFVTTSFTFPEAFHMIFMLEKTLHSHWRFAFT